MNEVYRIKTAWNEVFVYTIAKPGPTLGADDLVGKFGQSLIIVYPINRDDDAPMLVQYDTENLPTLKDWNIFCKTIKDIYRIEIGNIFMPNFIRCNS